MGLNKLLFAPEPFSLDNSLSEFVKLLNSGNIEVYLLQAYAHRLIEQRIAVTEINAAAYQYFEGVLARRNDKELKRAELIAEAFSGGSFQWHYWMHPDVKGQTIKGTGEK